MKLSVRRIYEPKESTKSVRVLIDRLWPRGVSRAKAAIDIWAKELAPTAELRKWFHEDPEKRYQEFTRRYAKELSHKKALVPELFGKRRSLTLVTAVRDIEHSHVPALVAFLRRF